MNCLALIFSRDRALQLDACLKSFLSHWQDKGSAPVRVLYKTTTPVHSAQYQELVREYQQYAFIQFIPQEDFRKDVLTLLGSFDHVLFMVDDIIFVSSFCLEKCCDLLREHADAVGVSLRLGRNTTYFYPLDKIQVVPEMVSVDEAFFKFNWTQAKYDFGYPLELCSSVYRVQTLYELLSHVPFHTPNTLESCLAERAGQFTSQYPHLLCLPYSAAFSNPVNLVQTDWENRNGRHSNFSSESLANLFKHGARVRVEAYDHFRPDSVHQEVPLELHVPSHDETTRDRKTPTVSVVIPCYQQAEFLAESVNSVMRQTYIDWEIVIVDDGSSDHTSEVAASLCRQYSEKSIRFIKQSNKGLAEARNAGIRASVGHYILPLDSDDILAPTMLERTVHLLDDNPEIGIAYAVPGQPGV